MGKPKSITTRLIAAVLITEAIAAILLIVAVVVHERHVRFNALDANVRGTANVLLGAVVDAEDTDDNIVLDLRGVTLPKDAVYQVRDEHGHSLGAAGHVPDGSMVAGKFASAMVDGRSYRFYVLHGDRFVDPGVNGGLHHQVMIVYGLPDRHVSHEVMEALRFFSIAAFVLLSLTAVLLVWLIRRLTQPIHQLSDAAEAITSLQWNFSAPEEARDVIELQPLVGALEQALARLHRSFEQQKRFTSDAAHELKTDLAIVKSSFQLLSMKQRTSEEYQKGVSVGLLDLARLEATVQKMLTLARLEQQAEAGVPACRLDAVLEQAILQATPAAELKDVALRLVTAAPATVRCDTRDALLLCSNILMNAIHYTGDGTDVRIECSVSDSQCTLRVEDAGRGVEESEVPFLFEPFYRGDPSRSRTSGSTGLGLSICKAICERAGGSISLANRPQGGAVVTVQLPLADFSGA